MSWLWYSPWIIPIALPLIYLVLWRHDIRRKPVFFVASVLSAIGIAFVALLLAGFVWEPMLRAMWPMPWEEYPGRMPPSWPLLSAAFQLTVNVGLLWLLMSWLRRALEENRAP